MYNDFDGFDGAIILLLVLLLLGALAVGILYLLALQKALQSISEENRKMPPGQVWLLLIPFFNLIWSFIVVTRIADSFSDEFTRLNIHSSDPRPTFNIGMAHSVLSLCGFIPFLGSIASIAGFICWIVYWVKVVECRKLIEANQNNMMLDAERGLFHGDMQQDQLKGW
jgi:cobalamin synthase